MNGIIEMFVDARDDFASGRTTWSEVFGFLSAIIGGMIIIGLPFWF